MSTVAINAFRDYLMPFAPTVPRNQIEQALRNKLLEFFRRTQYWRDEIVITPAVGTSTYALTPNIGDTRVGGVKRITQGDSNAEVIPTTPDRMYRWDRGWATRTGRLAEKYYMKDETTIVIVPIPDVAPDGNELDLTVSVWPGPPRPL